MTIQGPTRRAAIGGALGLMLGSVSGCRPFGTGRPSQRDIDRSLLRGVRATTSALRDRYTATAARYPDLAPQLAPLIADHTAHLRALPAGRGGSTPAAASPAAPQVPGPAPAALAGLADAESAAAAARITDALRASPPIARVLASIGGSAASHSAVLAELAGRSPGSPE
jgi:hypothetical protein